MVGLKRRVKNWEPPIGFQGSLNKKPQLAYAAEKIKAIFVDNTASQISTDESLKIWALLNEKKHSYEKLNSLPLKMIKKAPWVIFNTQFDDKALAADEDFFKHYLKIIYARKIKNAIANLYTVFLFSYNPSQPYFNVYRKSLPWLLKNNTSPRLDNIKQQAVGYFYFESDGPSRYANLLLESEVDIEKFIGDSGLTGFSANKGFIEYALIELLGKLSSKISSGKLSLVALPDYLEYFGNELEGKVELKFPSLRVELAESLLLPFINNNNVDNYVEDIQKFLLKYYGDPRTSAGNWRNITDTAKQVMLKWLVKNTLEDFFTLLDYSAKNDKTADRHWKYRKAFWSTYLVNGYITEAWVALAPHIKAMAEDQLKVGSNTYGELHGSNSSHAILMLRIGDQLIVDWNHSGSFRIWRNSSNSAPRMFKKSYKRHELVNIPDFAGSHSGSESGSWQRRIAMYLNEKTGAQVQQREYMKVK